MTKFARLSSVCLITGLGLVASSASFGDVDISPNAPARMGASAGNIRAHVEFLASDLLLGREVGSPGYDIAANYVATQFSLLGLTPGGVDGSYSQSISIMKTKILAEESGVLIRRGDEEITLVGGKSFGMRGGYGALKEAITLPVVFAGWGVKDDASGYNDFEGLDVEGKIVAVFMGSPSVLDPDQSALYMPPWAKMKIAQEQGAAGLMIFWNPMFEQIFPWKSAMQFFGTDAMSWIGEDGVVNDGFEDMAPMAMVGIESAKWAFEGAKFSYEEAWAMTQSGEIQGFQMPVEVALTRSSQQSQLVSRNIIGILEGSDPDLKNEYLVYTAHLDHIGQSPGHGAPGDSHADDIINNGAYDNATGIAIMIDTARRFAELPVPPKRSIIFLAVTGEEQGFIGSSYFALNPTVPAEAIIANVNIDMPILTFPVKDVIVYGASHSTLQAIVSEAVEEAAMINSADPAPQQSLFVRSDQISFIKQGIPSVFLVTGFISGNPEEDGNEARNEFMAQHYHQPSDDLALPFDRAAAERFANVNFLIGLKTAEAAERPRWNAGDFFGETFGRD